MQRYALIVITVLFLSAPLMAAAQAGEDCNPETDPLCVQLSEPLGGAKKISGDSGQDILVQYVGTIYVWAASIIGIIAVLILIVSGIQISAAAGDEQGVSSAKTRIFQSLGGLAILLLSGIILYLINPNFFTR